MIVIICDGDDIMIMMQICKLVKADIRAFNAALQALQLCASTRSR